MVENIDYMKNLKRKMQIKNQKIMIYTLDLNNTGNQRGKRYKEPNLKKSKKTIIKNNNKQEINQEMVEGENSKKK